jgi:hypothetical protein
MMAPILINVVVWVPFQAAPEYVAIVAPRSGHPGWCRKVTIFPRHGARGASRSGGVSRSCASRFFSGGLFARTNVQCEVRRARLRGTRASSTRIRTRTRWIRAWFQQIRTRTRRIRARICWVRARSRWVRTRSRQMRTRSCGVRTRSRWVRARSRRMRARSRRVRARISSNRLRPRQLRTRVRQTRARIRPGRGW